MDYKTLDNLSALIFVVGVLFSLVAMVFEGIKKREYDSSVQYLALLQRKNEELQRKSKQLLEKNREIQRIIGERKREKRTEEIHHRIIKNIENF